MVAEPLCSWEAALWQLLVPGAAIGLTWLALEVIRSYLVYKDALLARESETPARRYRRVTLTAQTRAYLRRRHAQLYSKQARDRLDSDDEAEQTANRALWQQLNAWEAEYESSE